MTGPWMAAEAGLGPWHSCRAFKAAAGCAPHRPVLPRRLARAQRPPRATESDLAEVAAACGFSSYGRLEGGTTSSAWRATSA